MSATRLVLRAEERPGVDERGHECPCERAGCCVLRLDGELDLQTEAGFTAALDALLRRGHAKIVLDVRGLNFCSCSGVAAMIAEQRQAEPCGGCLRPVGVHGPLARILDAAGLVDTFPPYADLRQACERSVT